MSDNRTELLDYLASLGVTEAELNEAMGSEEIRAGVDQRAQEMLTYWQSVSPERTTGRDHELSSRIGTDWDEPGKYRESIEIKESAEDGQRVIKVGTNWPTAHWIEYGSVHNAEHACAAKVIDAFGGDGTTH